MFQGTFEKYFLPNSEVGSCTYLLTQLPLNSVLAQEGEPSVELDIVSNTNVIVHFPETGQWDI